MTYSLRRPDGTTLSDDAARLDFAVVHAALAASYWSPGIARATVERAAAGSLPFGLYAPAGGPAGGAQVGYARVVSDRTTFAYPDLQGLRRWLLATRDAHSLYAQVGFAPAQPGLFMQRPAPGAPAP